MAWTKWECSQCHKIFSLEGFIWGTVDGERWCAICLAGEVLRLRTWQLMDSAPRDGTEVLLRVERRAGIPGCCLVGHYMPGGHCIEDHPPIDEGWYFWTGGMFDLAAKPIAWMPISKAAKAAKENEE